MILIFNVFFAPPLKGETLNINILNTDKYSDCRSVEEKYYQIISQVTKAVSIPVAVKIGHQFSDLVAFVKNLYAAGARGVVLFNRFFQPDIDIEKMRHIIETMTHFGFVITGDKGFDYGQVCQGGVALDDIDISNMECKKVKGVFFAGEVVDVDGKCGGYNLQWAWSSAYLAAAGVKERINN